MSKNIGSIATVKINITITLLILLTAIGLALIFILCPQYQEQIKFITAVIGGSSAIYSAYYLGAGLKSTINRDKLKASFEMISRFDDLDLTGARAFAEKELSHDGHTPEEFYKLICSEEDIHSVVKTLLGMSEDISLAVTSGYVDEEILHRSLGYIVPWAYFSFHSYIEYERKRTGDNEMYSELEAIAKAWKVNKSILTGQKVDWY